MKSIFIPLIAALLSVVPVGCTSAGEGDALTRMAPDAFEKAVKSEAKVVLLDIRTPGEYQSGHIPGAQLLNFYDNSFNAQLDKLSKDQPVYIYCQSSNRSMQAAQMMIKKGFTRIIELQGGMGAWSRAGKPVKS